MTEQLVAEATRHRPRAFRAAPLLCCLAAVAGRYAIKSTVGPKRVEIIAVRPKPGAKPKASGEGLINEMYIPDRYNLESELTADVTAAGPNEFDFKLE